MGIVIRKKTGNLNNINTSGRAIDKLSIEWFEANKRILHKKTDEGTAITIKFLKAIVR